jgi:hypothetical protein
MRTANGGNAARRRVTARAALAAAILIFAPATAAWAAPNSGADPPVTVSELVVTATKTVAELTVTAPTQCLGPDKMPTRMERPTVVSTFPKRGDVVRPGLLVVRVTFDRPMACDGSFTPDPPLPDPCPGADRTMLLSYDRRTVRTVCMVEPGAQYGLWVSRDPAAQSFVGLAGLPSLPYRLNFSTSSEAPIATVCDALEEDEVTARQIRARRKLDCASEP